MIYSPHTDADKSTSSGMHAILKSLDMLRALRGAYEASNRSYKK